MPDGAGAPTSGSGGTKLSVAALLLVCGFWSNGRLECQARPSETDVKAAYLMNFGKFIRVSGNAPARHSFDICVTGADPMAHALDSLAGEEQIDGRPVRIQRLKNPADARSCDIAYLSTSNAARIDSQLAAIGKSDVLTVGDAPHFLERGGMIQFVMVGQHVRFSVNLKAVRRTHLVLSSELLRVALSVTGEGDGGVEP